MQSVSCCVWSNRSLNHAVGWLKISERCNVTHQQGIDATTPAGKAMFQMMGVFAEFERSMIVERVRAGVARAKASGTKSGERRSGAPECPP